MFELEMVTFSAKFDSFVEGDRVLVAGSGSRRCPT